MIHSPKYQSFNNSDQPLRFDYTWAPQLMAAWKIPIRVSPEAIEHFKSLKRNCEEKEENGLPAAKRLKLDNDLYSDDGPVVLAEGPIDLDFEPLSPVPNTPSNGVVTSTSESSLSSINHKNEEKSSLATEENGKPPSPIQVKPYPTVVVSGFTRLYKDKIKAKIVKLGGTVTSDMNLATHLVLKEEYTTTKMFVALCRLKHIVTARWVYESIMTGKFVCEKKFSVKHEKFEQQFDIAITDVLEKPNRHILFKGVTFFLTPGNWMLKKDVERIVEAAGGHVDRSQKSLRHIRDYCSKFPKRSVIITSHDDFELMQDFLMGARRPHVINIYDATFIWHSIATQTVKLRQSMGDGKPKQP